MRRVLVSFIGLFLSCAALCHAADYLTLDEAIGIALKNNPLLKAEDENVRGRGYERNISFANMLPSVDLSYGYQRQNKTPTMPLPLTSFVGGQPVLTTVDVPTGYAQFPREILRPPRSLAARTFADIRRWSVMQHGGHFAAMEQPEALADEVRAFFRPLRHQG